MQDDGWRKRLAQALAESGKSARAVSVGAGFSAAYLYSVLTKGKDPSVMALFAICAQIPVDPAFILLGITASPEDVAVLRALQEHRATREGLLKRSEAAQPPEPSPRDDPRPSDG